MPTIKVQLVTPERTLLDQAVDSLTCQTSEGQITILPNHEPLVAVLQAGELVARSGADTVRIAVAGGFVEVRRGNLVVILADAAEHAAEIDEREAQIAMQRALEDIKQYSSKDAGYAAARAVYQHHAVRLSLARKHSHNRVPVPSEGVFKE